MDLAEAQELGVFQAGNHAQDARLLAELQVVLEADQVEALRRAGFPGASCTTA